MLGGVAVLLELELHSAQVARDVVGLLQREGLSIKQIRLIEPLRRVDEDSNIYDLTRVFFTEYGFFPFSPRDDLIDAMSRIYDMEPRPAVILEKIVIEDFADS